MGFESIEFGRRFQVWTSPREDAHLIIDQRMMAWLLDDMDDVRFEVNNGLVACATWRVIPEQLPQLAEILIRFVERIPNVALRRFGVMPPSGPPPSRAL